MSDIKSLTDAIVAFRDKRNWKQFHNPKDVSLSLVLEAAEVMEHFQWKTREEMDLYIKSHKEDIAEELADVLYWVLLLSQELQIDIAEALKKKMKKNEIKYPVSKSINSHKKYTEL